MLSSASSSTEALLRHNHQALHSLRRRWLGVALAYAAATLAGHLFLRTVWSDDAALRWLGLTMFFASRPLWLLWRHLAENHRREDERLLPDLGYGNVTTLARGWCIAAVGGFFLSPWPDGLLAWLPAGLYFFAVILDGIDGYLARITNHTTKLGETLDISLDAWGLLAAILVAVWYGQLPVWYVPLGLSREFFIAGQWWLQRQGKPVYDLTPSAERRAIAGLQMGFVSLALWPIFQAPTTTIAAVLFGGQLFASFLRDWLVVSGAIDPAAPGYQRWRSRAKTLLQGWLPVAVRLIGAATAGGLLAGLLPEFGAWYGGDGPVPAGVAVAVYGLAVIWIGAIPALAAGIVPRLAAGALLLLALCDQQMAGFAWESNGLLQITATLVIQLGGGRWALWPKDDRLWYGRAGDRAGKTHEATHPA